jgi:hypothetical protein
VILDAVVADLDRLIESITISRDDNAEGGISVHFVPVSEMSQLLPSYVPGNDGYFSSTWSCSGPLTTSVVLIGSDVSETFRTHLIREEVTQAFGFATDSDKYQASIFQSAYTDVDSYAALDEVLISLLYDPRVKPNATAAELRTALTWKFSSND